MGDWLLNLVLFMLIGMGIGVPVREVGTRRSGQR